MAQTKEKQDAPKRRSRARRRKGRGRGRARTKSNSTPLHQRAASHFRPEDQQRGSKYFGQGRVHLEIRNHRALAKVQGSDQPAYAVGIDWSRVPNERKLHVFCECERYASGTPCKHLWATLLELDANHQNRQPAGKDRVGLRKEVAADWPDLGLDAGGSRGPQKKRAARKSKGKGKKQQEPSWRSQLEDIEDTIESLSGSGAPDQDGEGEDFETYLLVNTGISAKAGGLVLDVFGRRRTGSGKPGKLKRARLDFARLEELLQSKSNGHGETPPSGWAVVAALPVHPPRGQNRRRGQKNTDPAEIQRIRLPASLYDTVLPGLCEAELLRPWDGRRLGNPKPLRWDADQPWSLALQLEFAAAKRLRVRGMLERDDEHLPLSKAQLILPPAEACANGAGAESDAGGAEICDALMVVDQAVAKLAMDPARDQPWIDLLQGSGELIIPEEDLEEGLTSLLELPRLPRLAMPDELQLSKESGTMRPRLVLEPEDAPEWMNPQLVAEVSFGYGDLQVAAEDTRPAIVDWDRHLFARRDMDGERNALVRLLELGFKPIANGAGDGLELEPQKLPLAAEPLLMDGWEVEAHGISIRPPSPPKLRVDSGVDWFELSGQVDFEGDPVDLSEVLAAISRGDRTVELEDGSKGLLPESWMETYDSLAKLAQDQSDAGLRFLPSQALLVDALLTAMPPANVDKAFGELRDKLRTFERIKPKKEPRGFNGELRGYQRMGLGWLCFLREFGLGGVLADDMGLGKTVQALALMRTYRTASKTTKLPFLVVAPRSLVYNWMEEAKRFVPDFKVVEYGGPDREALHEEIGSYDLVITTYGTLRRDIGWLATVEFDTVILDEAQAIKNPESQTAKASRLLNGRHRLALTGTPIENHLGELGSIFEFLNPGLLGRLPALDVLAGGREASKQELALVSKGIRPFILRRTKEEVLPDLPEKTEQVLQCELGDEQRELYDKVRAGYRESLLKQVEAEGIKGSTMQVLEALLRLRQIACHPGLVNEEWNEAGSAKLEILEERIDELIDEGHKLVVFSQFTSLLAYVREMLDARGLEYAYLDGQTRNRGEIVERFQADDGPNIFLISLKAGGVGLNLTAASYVFLLDPWWNPAVEAQAIDRTHRIGQTQKVFAYKLIARDTVEEKMVELQRSKRQLADAILDGEGKTLKDLTADDLKMLLS